MNADFREARPEDVETLLLFQREFAAAHGYAAEESTARRTLLELLGDASLGRLWLIVAGGSPVGYVVLTLGFSLEHGGRDAILDELFVAPRARGQGLGRTAVSFVLAEAARLGARSVHLEVERSKPSAQRLYRSLGFEGNDRQLLTVRLPAPGSKGSNRA